MFQCKKMLLRPKWSSDIAITYCKSFWRTQSVLFFQRAKYSLAVLESHQPQAEHDMTVSVNVCVCMSMRVRAWVCVCVCVFLVPGFCIGTGKLEPSSQAGLCSVTKADWLTSDCVGPLAEDEGAFSLTQEQEVSPSPLQQHSFMPDTMRYYRF